MEDYKNKMDEWRIRIDEIDKWSKKKINDDTTEKIKWMNGKKKER